MKNRSLISLLLVGMVTFSIRVSPGQSALQISLLDQLFKTEKEQYFSFKVDSPSILMDLSRTISIDRVDQSGQIYAYANRKGFSRFLELALPYEILPHPGDYEGILNMASHVNVKDIAEWDFYPTYDAYVDMMYQFAADYPAICQVYSIGQTIEGRELLVAKITDNVGLREKEPQFFYTSSIHGDELTGYVLMLRMIDYLLSNYGTDPRITNMVDNIEIWINPLANPDGTYFGGNNSVNGARRFNSNGVDINRNFPDPEDGQHPDGEDWQQETQRFMEFAESHHIVSSANLHGGEEVCNYPWDTWSRLHADDAWWQYVCHEYADTVHLHSPGSYMSDFDNGITNGYAWYSISGGRQDYMNFFHQAREFTLEISDMKLLTPSQLPAHWEYNYRSLLNYMEQSMFGIQGTVRDSVSGWPIKAEVYISLHEMDSSWVYSEASNGNFNRLVYEGNYTVRFSAPGYITKFVHDVNVINRQAVTLDVKLAPEGVGGIENNEISGQVNIRPNPSNDGMLYFQSGLRILKAVCLDITGKEIKEIELDNHSGVLDLKEFGSGLYFIRFETDEGVGIKKIIIKR